MSTCTSYYNEGPCAHCAPEPVTVISASMTVPTATGQETFSYAGSLAAAPAWVGSADRLRINGNPAQGLPACTTGREVCRSLCCA